MHTTKRSNTPSARPAHDDPDEALEIDRLLDWSQIKLLIPLSRSTVWALRRRHLFPSPVIIAAGARVAWRRSDIVAWLQSRQSASC